MKPTTYNLQPTTSQDGVTLLISILILSGLALIAITVGFFAVQEIKASRAVILSEPAIGAAETGGEQGVWALKRSGSIALCPTTTISSLGNNSVVDLCKSYGAASLDISAGVANTFYLYNPNDINGDASLTNYPYTYLQIVHKAGSFSVNVAVTRIDGSPVANQSVSPGNTVTINIPAVIPPNEGRMKVALTSFGNTTIEANTNQGMPDYPTIDSSGCTSVATVNSCSAVNDTFKRRIQIVVPQ